MNFAYLLIAAFIIADCFSFFLNLSRFFFPLLDANEESTRSIMRARIYQQVERLEGLFYLDDVSLVRIPDNPVVPDAGLFQLANARSRNKKRIQVSR